MGIGRLDTEEQLQAFIRQVVDDEGPAIRRLQGDLSGLSFHGPYDTGLSGAIPSETDVAFTINHDLGLTDTTKALVALANLYDGFYSSLASWRSSFTADTVVVHIGNPTNNPNVNAGLRFFVATW